MSAENKKDTKSKETGAKKKTVSPGTKDVQTQARNLLLRHPELLHNGSHYFRNHNGETIVQEVVPRGDEGPSDVQTQYDVSSDDVNSIIQDALKNIDVVLLRYNPGVALEDALTKIIWSKDNGKFASKVNANTFNLMLEAMTKEPTVKTASDKADGKADDDTVDKTEYEVSPGKTIELDPKQEAHVEKMTKGKETGLRHGLRRPDVDKIVELKKQEEVSDKDTAPAEDSAKSNEDTNKDKQEDLEMSKMDKKAMQEELQALSQKVAALTEALAKDETADNVDDAEKTASEDIIEALEVIATDLENAQDPELLKVAYQIDSICDLLEGKEGSAMNSDTKDEGTEEKGNVACKKASFQPPYQIK